MSASHALVIAIDGLRASALGSYGNTWHATPALDALASESLLFDWMYGHAAGIDGFYRAAWGGEDRPPESDLLLEALERVSLPRLLSQAGVYAALTTDEQSIAERGETAAFDEVRLLNSVFKHQATSVADTELAQLFAMAADQLQSWAGATDSRLLWLHARGYHGAWDAPQELRGQLLDENDPPAPTFVFPSALTGAEDHDALLLHRAAYAAQTMVLDQCVAGLKAALVEFELDRNALVILMGCRGYALGEHSVAGGETASLYGEQLHIPCLVRIPSDAPPLPRSTSLVQPVDALATLCDWFGAAAPALPHGSASLLSSSSPLGETERRQFAIAHGTGGEQAIRTPAWFLRRRASGAGAAEPAVELYAKPDDRWEANEVADRCPDILAGLLAVLERATVAGSPVGDEPLPAELMTGAGR